MFAPTGLDIIASLIRQRNVEYPKGDGYGPVRGKSGKAEVCKEMLVSFVVRTSE